MQIKRICSDAADVELLTNSLLQRGYRRSTIAKQINMIRRLSREFLLRKSQKEEPHLTTLIPYHSRLWIFGRDLRTCFREFSNKSIRICYTLEPNVQKVLNRRIDFKSSKQCNHKNAQHVGNAY
ncbi:hypothetical protein GJ496_007142 [Pomphorhynchus laevis]|nr:hypothetical protein GJ496_007142 [Pomphorhynchus laevis]